MQASGQAAIVTGGASGLGGATAKALRAAGANVAIVDADGERAKRYADEIGALAVVCDVRDGQSAEQAVAAARAAHGPARILVNCAGIGTPGKAVGRDGPLPLEVFSRVIEVNLIGTFNVIRLVAAEMQKLDPCDDNERGVIVNTASVAAYDGQIGQVAYAASKGGVVAMTLPLAREFAQFGIRVMTIAPGIFETPMLRGLPEAAQQSLAASIPYPSRLGDPAEYAALVMSILDNHMLNGEVIRLDGAIRMAPR
ncbi:MAG: SDR family NAD(P)-dependent oxidoreductase [Proteobacteria bacterium]|nr:SDR family NAD(P)-dependent oxidoreductase [Pseudomonadota bacterium]